MGKKIIKLCLVCLLMLLVLSSCASIKQAREERERKAEERRAFVAEYAPYFGLPSDLKLLPYVHNEEEIINNFVYHALVGEYDFTLNFTSEEEAKAWFTKMCVSPTKNSPTRMHQIINAYMDLMEVYCVAKEGKNEFKRDGSTIKVHTENNLISSEEFFQLQLEGIELAKQMYQKIHDKGYIKDGMTQKEIVEAYCIALTKENLHNGNEHMQKYARFKTPGVTYGTYYNCLAGSSCMSPAKIHTLNILLRMEGIQCQPVRFFNDDPNYVLEHDVLSRILADGEIIFATWGSKLKTYVGQVEDTISYKQGSRLENNYIKRF